MFRDKPRDAGDSKRGAEHEFTLEELRSQCDLTAPAPEPTGWEARSPMGDEII